MCTTGRRSKEKEKTKRRCWVLWWKCCEWCIDGDSNIAGGKKKGGLDPSGDTVKHTHTHTHTQTANAKQASCRVNLKAIRINTMDCRGSQHRSIYVQFVSGSSGLDGIATYGVSDEDGLYQFVSAFYHCYFSWFDIKFLRPCCSPYRTLLPGVKNRSRYGFLSSKTEFCSIHLHMS